MTLLKINELIPTAERVSNFIFRAGIIPKYHAKDADEKAKIIGEYTRRFICDAGISENGIHLMVAEELGLQSLTRMKAYHAVRYGGDFTQRKIGVRAAYANVRDVDLKRARKDTQEGVARDLISAIERAEQEVIRANPPVYCKAFIERSDYPILSLYDDYKAIIESTTLLFILRLQVFGDVAWATFGEVVTWDDSKEERKKWKKCGYKFCLNVFPTDKNNIRNWPAKRKDACYCDDQCKNGAHNAERSYERTGSYLPEWYWLPRLSESVGDDIRKHEFTAESDKIEKRINKKKPMRHAVIKDDTDEVAKAKSGEVTVYKNAEEADRAYIPQGVKI